MRVTQGDMEKAAAVLERLAVVMPCGGLTVVAPANHLIAELFAAHRIAAFKAGMEHAERIWRSVQYSPAPYTDGKAKLAQAIRDASHD